MRKQTRNKWITFIALFSVLTGLWTSAGLVEGVVHAQDAIEQPEFVGLPGTHQSEAGCPGDWQPDCEATALVFDEQDGIWQGSFLIQPENDQDKQGGRYKVALNKAWGENYGLNGQSGGADIPLVVEQPTEVKFYYDHATHWVADSHNNVIATVVGNFQQALGCQENDDPGCLRSWLQDPDGDEVYAFSSAAIPAGEYEARVAINESLDEVYGVDGAAGGAAIRFSVPVDGQEMYFGYDSAAHTLLISAEGPPRGDLSKAQAYWLKKDTIAWKVGAAKNGETYALFYSADASLEIQPGKISGGESNPLNFERERLDDNLAARYPYLSEYSLLVLDGADLPSVPDLLKGQVAVVEFNSAGKVTDATGLQIAGVLDDLYFYDGPLGVIHDGDAPELRLWAPTARSVSLQLFTSASAPETQVIPMTVDPVTGVWSIRGDAGWNGQYYLYEVEVFVPREGQVLKRTVTDPYSISLATNSLRSQIVNLDDAELKPQEWDALQKPPLPAPEDSVIYELHIRDFSIMDESMPADLRGTYQAFTQAGSNGMKHLQSLAQAGLTHIHLLPAFDIASIDEDKSLWQTVPASDLSAMGRDTDAQANALQPFRDTDGFNWGYDPYHYSTPEGSYASNPEGSTRIVEFREMVQALNQTGLRVVMDVVYNHTNASGESARSVLDKVVPGYYHRLNAEGQQERSTCCENTASENLMMEKLMIDSLVMWAKAYKVDGFRVDLMGHHMASNMVNVRQALDALTVEKDGVDGKQIILYGEGWDFGEVAGNARGVNATQLNLAGTGIGTFNDRLRDAARGGGPFAPVQEQGFITGLFTDSNAYDQGRPTAQKGKLLNYMDWIRIGLAGNLKDFELLDARGNLVRGDKISYNGAPAGYTLDPQEQIVYISAHDNETLFDAIQYKAPMTATPAERTRINNLGVSIVLLSQGIPFFHAGDDLLRSKSLDGNSYNSGDWYNKLDFSYQSNNWAVGLPDFRREQWDLMKTMFNEPNLAVGASEIQFAHAHFLEMLQMRKSSPLFRMQTGKEIKQRLTFLGSKETTIPGVIVMVLDDSQGQDLDPNFEKIVVVFNATTEPASFVDDALKGLALKLHPLQAASLDGVVKGAGFGAGTGMLSVPGRSAAVFVLKQTEPEPTATVPATEAPAETATAVATARAVIEEPTDAPAAAEPAASAPNWGVAGLVALLVAAAGGAIYWLRGRK